MKILISDYATGLMTTHDYEYDILKFSLPDAEIEVYVYTDERRDEFLEKMEDVDALLTAYIKIDKEVFDRSKKLKCISINATGYDNIDLKEATKRRVGVFPVGEYCTLDVAEHTMALMLALNKNIKHYISDIDERNLWKYDSVNSPVRIGNQVLGIFGLGKIGKRVLMLAKGLGMEVIAHDINVDREVAKSLGVKLVDKETIFRTADVIANHMSLDKLSTAYFTRKEFELMQKKPIFLNLGRGKSVNEDDLAYALDTGLIRAAGLDVLCDENQDLKHHKLARRENVIITPHSAFFSVDSMRDLQRISCENIVYYLLGKKEKVFKMVNEA